MDESSSISDNAASAAQIVLDELGAEVSQLDTKIDGLTHFNSLIETNDHFTPTERETVAHELSRCVSLRSEKAEMMREKMNLYESSVVNTKISLDKRQEVIDDAIVAHLLESDSTLMEMVVTNHAELTQRLTDASKMLAEK